MQETEVADEVNSKNEATKVLSLQGIEYAKFLEWRQLQLQWKIRQNAHQIVENSVRFVSVAAGHRLQP